MQPAAGFHSAECRKAGCICYLKQAFYISPDCIQIVFVQVIQFFCIAKARLHLRDAEPLKRLELDAVVAQDICNRACQAVLH